MKFKKRKKIQKFLFLGFLFLCLCGFDSAWAEEVKKGYEKPEIRQADKNFNIEGAFSKTNNPFFYGSPEQKMERTFPFYSMPYSEFRIDFDKNNKKFYQSGEEAFISGKISYSSSNAEAEINKIREDCLSDQKNKQGEKNEEICEAPPVYYFPSFSNVSILAQIWRKEEDETKMQAKGDHLVDEFYVAEDFFLGEKDEKEFELQWKVPENLKSGKYYAAFFVNQNKHFTLFGFPVNIFSPFTRFDFELIRGENDLEGGVLIDKNNIKINDQEYSQVLPAPSVEEKDRKINFEIPIYNPGLKAESVKVMYSLQRWTQENPEDEVSKKEDSLNLNPESSEILRFDFSPNELDSFYNLQVTVFSEGAKSMTDIHFAVKDKNRGVIRFLGVGKNRSEEANWPIFCLRNANWQGVFPGKFEISVFDSENKKVTDWRSEGEIEAKDGICFVIKDPDFFGKKPAECLKMEGVLTSKNNKLSDKKTILLNCDSNQKEVSGEKKKSEGVTLNFIEGLTLQKKREALIFLTGLILIIVLIAGIIIIKYIKNNKEIDEP